jgi:ATP-dependent phosphoenolpyruvate carboxykinase
LILPKKVALGTDTGEMKRDIFCIELHIACTQKNTLPMHSANVEMKETQPFSLVFWNRKTTLSADPKRN